MAAPSSRRPVKSKRRWLVWGIGLFLLAGAATGATFLLAGGTKTARADLLYHKVKYEDIDLTVVERGALESAENKDVICRVKASKGGQFATTIKWIIDDGTYVKRGQHLCTLDSAALEDQLRTQLTAVATADAACAKSLANLETVIGQSVTDVTLAENAVITARLALERYVGLPQGILKRLPPEKSAQYLDELEENMEQFLAKNRGSFSDPAGEYHKLLNDFNGKISGAEGDFQNWKDRLAFTQRMQIKGYQTSSQVQADESRTSSAKETLKSLDAEKGILKNYTAQETVKLQCRKVKEVEETLKTTLTLAQVKKTQAIAELKSQRLILVNEQERQREIEEQIKECKLHAPQDGMVVYFISDQSRFGSGSQQSIIAQGEPVREGQKLMRIPNLRKMQVNTRIHEAMISRIRGDIYEATGFSDSLRATSALPGNMLPNLYLLSEELFEDTHTKLAYRDFKLSTAGQTAALRIDAFPEKSIKGHVKMKAAIASQQDIFSSDVKVYQTLIAIDELLFDGDQKPALRPGMSAEVRINVDRSLEHVLVIPIQAIVGGAENGDERRVFVKTPAGTEERKIKIGQSNGKVAEVKSGLQEDDEVVTNPKVLLGDTAKTRDAEPKGGPAKGAPGKGGPPAK